jgi:hypothetical protein
VRHESFEGTLDVRVAVKKLMLTGFVKRLTEPEVMSWPVNYPAKYVTIEILTRTVEPSVKF